MNGVELCDAWLFTILLLYLAVLNLVLRLSPEPGDSKLTSASLP
jgi:hypothetical protein